MSADDFRLRDGCEMPVQPPIPAEARSHPKYQAYLKYRAAMTNQLVTAMSWHSWLDSSTKWRNINTVRMDKHQGTEK